jgi:hypothetical protein
MLDTLNTLDTLNFPCFCLTQAEALPVFYHVLPCFTMFYHVVPSFPTMVSGQDSKWTSWRTILVNQKAQELLGLVLTGMMTSQGNHSQDSLISGLL